MAEFTEIRGVGAGRIIWLAPPAETPAKRAISSCGPRVRLESGVVGCVGSLEP